MSAEGPVCSAGGLARHLDVTSRRIQELAAAGIVRRLARGRYDLDASRMGYVRWLREQAEGRVPNRALYDARRRREEARARHEELEVARIEGELLPRGPSEKLVASLASRTVTRLFAIPTKLAPLVYAAETVAEVQALIREALEEACQEISETRAVFLPDESVKSATNRPNRSRRRAAGPCTS